MASDVPRQDTAVGPSITGLIDLRGPDTQHAPLENALIIEDGAIPGALASVIPLALCAAAEGVPEDAERGGCGNSPGSRSAHITGRSAVP